MDTKALRQKILDLAIRGKLVPQDPNDEPASVLLERIHAEKQQMVKDGKLKPKDIKNDTVIFKGDDNLHYEKFSDGTVKCIEDELPFDVPEGWKWARLNDLALYKKGPFGSSITKAMFVPESDNAIKVYEQKNAINKNAHLGHYFISQEKYQELKGFEIFPGDIIVSCAGTIGETFVMPSDMRKGIINQALMKIHLYDNSIKDFYLMYFDNKLKSLANEQGYGMALKNIPPFSVLKQYLIPIPPMAEQEKILERIKIILSNINDIDLLKGKLQSNIANAKSKILDLAIRGKLVPQDPNDEPASVLLERIQAEKEELIKQGKMKRDKKDSVIFKGDDNSYYLRSSDNNSYDVAMIFNLPKNWEWCLLGDIFNVSSSKRVLKNEWKSSGVPFYRAREIVKLSINGTVDNDLFISPEHYENLRRNYGVPNAGDLMVTGVGTIGKVYIVKENDVFYYKDASVLCFENIYKAINPRFAKLMLDSSLIQNQIHSKTYGNTVDTITISTAKNYLCVLPPLAEQKRIVDEIEKIFATLDNIANQVA